MIHARILRGVGGGGRGSGSPLNNHKNIGFHSNTGANPLKSKSYQEGIQGLAVIGTPANVIQWRFAGEPMIVRFFQIKDVRVGPLLTKLSGVAHAIPTQILSMHMLKVSMFRISITHCRQIQGTMRKGEALQFLHEEIIYSNKKDTSDFHGTVSFDPIKMSQQKI